MKPARQDYQKWQLTRERFCIEDEKPPPPARKEKFIKEILTEITAGEQIEHYEASDVLIDRWPAITGEQIARHTNPVFLKNSVLTVYADHAGWLAEARRIPKNFLLKKISTVSGLPKIKEIRFQLDPLLCNRK
ncbi:MAG: DUF721 domain-containing protein [Kiritimatiellales bacterium]